MNKATTHEHYIMIQLQSK